MTHSSPGSLQHFFEDLTRKGALLPLNTCCARAHFIVCGAGFYKLKDSCGAHRVTTKGSMGF